MRLFGDAGGFTPSVFLFFYERAKNPKVRELTGSNEKLLRRTLEAGRTERVRTNGDKSVTLKTHSDST